ncbi:MAG TPA: hypothetical protein VHZ03_24180 [Trebonia sp.]|jgi:hypothetical protein|nr:hypothetical protein [Trebonia sp.]
MFKTAAVQQPQRWTRFEHPVAFWLGAAACTAGVVLHLAMYYSARGMGYKMAGMRPDGEMLVGMALIIAGLAAALYGLLPRGSGQIRKAAAGIRVRALDDAPISVVATAMHGFWSSRKTIIAFFGLLALSLFGFVIAGNSLVYNHALLTAMLVVPLSGISLVAAIVTVCASEVYPTRIRSRGTGLAAGITKAGGVLIIAMVVAAATTPSIALTAVIGAVPLLIGMAIFALTSRETRGRRLEEISQTEFVAVPTQT